MHLWLDLVKPTPIILDACVSNLWQATSDHIYSSLPPYKSRLLIILVGVNDVKGKGNESCKCFLEKRAKQTIYCDASFIKISREIGKLQWFEIFKLAEWFGFIVTAKTKYTKT